MPEHSLRVEAVVLRHNDWGEADRLLSLYTREQGKLRTIAKGVRRMRSRKAGHLEPFTRVALLLARGRDFWIITQAETVDAYLPLGEDLVRIGYAAYVIELLDRFTYEEGENRALYSLLVDTLGRVTHEPDPFLAVRYYEMRLFDLVGFRPNLFQCMQCGRVIKPQDQFFSAERGGVLCPKCGSNPRTTQGNPRTTEGNAPATRPVSMQTLKFMRHFQRSSYPEACRAVLSPSVQAEMESLHQFFITYLLERALNTPAFLREVREKNK